MQSSLMKRKSWVARERIDPVARLKRAGARGYQVWETRKSWAFLSNCPRYWEGSAAMRDDYLEKSDKGRMKP